MGLSKAQEIEYKNICKEMVKELLSDKDFMEIFCNKIIAAVTKKLSSETDKFKKQITTLETKLNKIQGDHKNLKEENEILKNQICNVTQLDKSYDEKLIINKLDDLEQHSKMGILRIFGIPESKDENLGEELLSIFNDKLEISNCQIEYCYRIGVISKEKKPRPVLVKFSSMIDRDNIFYSKKKLKGFRLSISEDLTKLRYKLLQLAKDKFGQGCVWTKRGDIYAKVGSKKYRIRTNEDFENVVI